MSEQRFYTMQDGRRIAFRTTDGSGPAPKPAIVFLPGYMSDMAGSKATAVFDWAQANGRAGLLLDYSGCGLSEGAFSNGSLSRWREEVLALIEAVLDGPVVLVGSSMGGWLMLLCGLELGDRLAGLVGIAAAPDFTDWGYDPAQKAKLAAGETILEDNPYGYDPTPTHPLFWADGEANRMLESELAIDCPVRLLHGQRDADVPWEISMRLAAQLRSADVQLTLIKHGDHRLSRDEDIALLLRTIAALPRDHQCC